MDISEYEKGKIALSNLLKKYLNPKLDYKKNEATTRLQIIDELIFSCLGWDKDDCRPEEPWGGEFADYVLYSPQRALIIEAKKEGIYFELPAGKARREYNISTLITDNEQLRAAVEQVLGYCQKRGVPLACVCNGHQIVAFIASRRDGIPPLEGRAIVFDSLQAMFDNSLELWNALSKPAVIDHKLEYKLLGRSSPVLPTKLSTVLLSYPGTKSRNTIQTDLQILSDLIIEDISKDPDIEEEFLKATYCQSGALSQYALISKSILQSRYELLFDRKDGGPTLCQAVTKKGLSKDVFAKGISNRPILLLGDVGCGKTMFIRYFMKIAAIAEMNETIPIYVDLGSKAALTCDLKEFFLNEVQRILLIEHNIDLFERNFVHGVYHIELERFAKTIYGEFKESDPKLYLVKQMEFLESKITNKVEHVQSCLGHITKGRKKQIVIFMDNADQRDVDIQEHAFLISQEIAGSWPATVFLTIRPETFYKSKKEGTLSGYHPKAFTIEPPRVDQVISKRLNFAHKIARGELSVNSMSQNISLCLETLAIYIEILQFSFDHNRELIEFIDNICYSNIRLALEYVTTFIGSGHVDTKKILDRDEIHRKKNSPIRYIVPLHEYLRAVIFGDHEYYYPKATSIVNVFDITLPDSREHFLLPIILKFFLTSTASVGNGGFIDTSKIYQYAQEMGFRHEQVEMSVLKALDKKLIEGEGRARPEYAAQLPLAIRITTIGAYHVQSLLCHFAYIDAIIVDTPILDDNTRKTIADVNTINERISRVNCFCEYLNSNWSKIDSSATAFSWPDIYESLQLSIKNIQGKINQQNVFQNQT